MLALWRLRTSRPKFCRGNATVGNTAANVESPLPPPLKPASARPDPPHFDAISPAVNPSEDAPADTATQNRTRGRSYTNRRPNISLDRPREWSRPIPFGVLPAYDHALKVIKKDSEALKSEVQQLRTKLEKAESASEKDDVALREMRDKLHILEVQSEINLPDVRWKFANGMADLSKPVYRHLVEQRWRNEGALDLLMERIHQMKVVPDVLPDLHPSLDFRITFPEALPKASLAVAPRKPKFSNIEPGIYLLPEQTREPPKLFTTVFHLDTRLYTLLMVDPDVPDEENQGFRTYLHWMQPNIPLSVSSSSITSQTWHTPYIPPHPQRGTPYHRYTLLLLPQSSGISIPALSNEDRVGFDVREFIKVHKFDMNGGGAHMWREVWDEDVSNIYRDVLRLVEPRYGRQPKPDRYAAYKNTKRYI